MTDFRVEMSDNRVMELAMNRTIVENLLAHAVSAARIVGHLDERVASAFVEELADHIDAIVHELSELLGNPSLTEGSATTGRVVLADPTVVALGHSQGGAR